MCGTRPRIWPSTAGMVSGSGGSVSVSESGAGGREGGARPGLVLRQAGGSRSSTGALCPQRVPSTGALGAGLCSVRSRPDSLQAVTILLPHLRWGQTGAGRWAGALGAGRSGKHRGGCAPILLTSPEKARWEGSAVLRLRVPTCLGSAPCGAAAPWTEQLLSEVDFMAAALFVRASVSQLYGPPISVIETADTRRFPFEGC